MSPFQYPPLFPLELRLLELQPGLPEDPLAGTILKRKLSPEDSEVPDYEALSYCWGDQSHRQQIKLETKWREVKEQRRQTSDSGSFSCTNLIIHSGCLDIGSNLASALRALRYHDRKRLLWCDSICINQKDVEDRSAQVQRMADVYQFAQRVIVWLGPATPWSSTVMETMLWVRNQLSSPAINCSWHQGVTANFAPTADGSRQEIDCDGPLPLSQDQWLAFEQLLAVDWFRRLWTHQEIVLANQETSIVRLGDEEMPWTKFIEAALFLCVYVRPGSRPFFLDLARHARNVQVFTWKAWSTMSTVGIRRVHPNWVALLWMTNHYDCSDDRDRLYALRGLLDPITARLIRVDYTKSAKQIVASASVAHIKQMCNLQFLEVCNSATSPSWVLDLHGPMNRIEVLSDAGARSAASARLVKSGMLEVAGVSCDEITTRPIDIPAEEDFEFRLEYIANLVLAFRDLTGNDDFHRDDKCLDELITLFTFGRLWDYSTVRTESPPSEELISLEVGRRIIRRWMTGNINLDDFFCTLYNRSRVAASAYTRTRNGTLACVPLESCEGDIIATLLGLSCNLVLRPQPQDGSYKVVGPCYHPGFSNGQALLGDNFRGWEKLWCMNTKNLVFWKEGEPLRLSDPRLDGVPLPVGYTERRVETVGKDTLVWFHEHPYEDYVEHNIDCDPRNSEYELRKRGVPIQRFRLI